MGIDVKSPEFGLLAQTDLIDDRVRGVPPGTAAISPSEVPAQGWRPADGVMALPVLTLDEAAFANNRDLMLRYVKEHGVEIAPHAKTPMCPELAASLVKAGAWGTTVADIRQASVMLKAGLMRLLLANEVGGRGGALRLARLLASYPKAEFFIFADSPEAVAALAEAWRLEPAAPNIGILVEVGAGRAGARDAAAADRVIEAIRDPGPDARLALAGVATYEGTVAVADAVKTRAAIDDLMALTHEVYGKVRGLVGPEIPLILTAGGSSYFDWVVAALQPMIAADGNARLILRSGAIFFQDHGGYARAMAAIDERDGFAIGGRRVAAAEAFRPALRLWAEVLSRPEPGLAVCGMGMRDVSYDQDLPRPLRVHRDGRPLVEIAGPEAMQVLKLNDQHAFVAVDPQSPICVGDVIEFGISHPCTCMDKWRVLFGLDEKGRVVAAHPTFFG
ncbi:MAG: alanine racemase [Methylobacteriaceae bacterium]|nr:alanine racemase [Methylobacteriaceae bacterium]